MSGSLSSQDVWRGWCGGVGVNRPRLQANQSSLPILGHTPITRPLTAHGDVLQSRARCCWAAEGGFQRLTRKAWPTPARTPLLNRLCVCGGGSGSCGVTVCGHHRGSPFRVSMIGRIQGEHSARLCPAFIYERCSCAGEAHTAWWYAFLLTKKSGESHTASLCASEQMYCRTPLWAAAATSLLSS